MKESLTDVTSIPLAPELGYHTPRVPEFPAEMLIKIPLFTSLEASAAQADSVQPSALPMLALITSAYAHS